MTPTLAIIIAFIVLAITSIAHVVISRMIRLVDAAANANPPRLRGGATRQQALARVTAWRRARKQLWIGAALVIVGGFVLAGLSL